ncbi:MAG: tetratricopeptide repeat protein [Chitinophagaceae bacterium]
MISKKINIFIVSTILFIALLVTYSNHFQNGFHFDDSHAVVDNVHIQSLKNIPEFFYNPKMFSSKPDHWGLRPLVTTSLAIDYWLGGGLNPFYFHLSTFIWFIILCVLLFFIYKNLIAQSIQNYSGPYLALFATALYALHPANAETINYIISRSDVLSTLCIVGSFAIYLFYPAQRNRYIYILPAIIGVFAKETVLMLVPLLFFYITLFEKNLSLFGLFKRKNLNTSFQTIISLLPLVAATAICQFYTMANTPHSSTGFTNPFFSYVLTQSYVWLHYFLTFFLPINLSADTDMSVISNPFDYRIIMGLAFIILLIYYIFKTSVNKQTKPISFGLTWFAFSLLPTSIAPLAEVMNDHRMFFPFIGLALATVHYIGLLLTRYQTKSKSNKSYLGLATILALFILTSFAYGTYERNKVWKNEESLWLDVTIKSPQNGRGLMNYGLTQMAKGNFEKAKDYFEKALVFTPEYSSLQINLGIVKNAMKKPVEAEVNFKKAIGFTPDLFEPYYYYADFLNKNNRIVNARPMAEKAASISPYYINARYLLMDIYQKLELWDNLEETAKQTLTFSAGDARAIQFLASSKKRINKLDNNIMEVTNNPTPENYLNLSLKFYNQGLYDKCIEACREAIKLKPDYADAYSNIGAAYNGLKKWDDAISGCNHALLIDPQHRLAKGNLQLAIKSKASNK